ncbi:RyR domain-containing protein [Paenisporosarcina sp. TG-14]|uniref:RyR domain-containing protein n=1 Tax=Paenisporosarcina sp. TG-14 TaxID=1231057 RepID=UPI0002F7BAAB|nr:RyR domain-containing protein [Paenisporosarcina sp. TG-14]
MKNVEIIEIAKVCHNVNKAYCEAQNDFSQTSWEDAPAWQKDSAMNGVEYHLNNDVTPEMSHENWLKQKLEEGWVYGKAKDAELKTHPCIMRYEQLPKFQRTKDALFKSVVDSFNS